MTGVRRTHVVKQQPAKREDTRPPITSSREVFIAGVPRGNKHRVDLRGSTQERLTRCGNVAGKGVPSRDTSQECVVCFAAVPGRPAYAYCHPCRSYHPLDLHRETAVPGVEEVRDGRP